MDIPVMKITMWALGWLGQRVLAWIAPLALIIMSAGWVYREPPGWAGLVVDYSLLVMIALSLALVVSSALPRSVNSGVWVWVAPVLFLLATSAEQLRQSGYAGLGLVFCGEGESGWLTLFVAMPAVGCCVYSSIMAWRLCSRTSTMT